MNLGYLAVRAAHDLANGSLTRGAKELSARGLGTIQIGGDNILLGAPFAFTKDSIDPFGFRPGRIRWRTPARGSARLYWRRPHSPGILPCDP
jgi:hypothetical protein